MGKLHTTNIRKANTRPLPFWKEIHNHSYNKHKKGQHTSTTILEKYTIIIRATKIRKANTTHEHSHFGKILMDWKSQTTNNKFVAKQKGSSEGRSAIDLT